MNRLSAFAWLSVVLLASCAPSRPPAGEAAAPLCRLAPNDGPLKDIAAPDIADRGIGGTGISPDPRLADRGIGGTGIVGTITGFASVCVNGLEVTYDPATPVQIDDTPAPATDLRAGDTAVIEAAPDLAARTIAVRHEVVGPVEAVEADGSAMTVAGQRVKRTPGTRGGTAARPGAWVAVSGSRNASGEVLATRIDPAAPGTVIVHGRLEISGVVWRIGAMTLRLTAPADLPPPGAEVVAKGRYESGILVVDSLAPDRLAGDPALYFGPGVTSLVIETTVGVADGWMVLGSATRLKAEGFVPRAPGVAIIELERRGGGFVPTGLAAPPGIGEGRLGLAPAFEAAPMPPSSRPAGSAPALSGPMAQPGTGREAGGCGTSCAPAGAAVPGTSPGSTGGPDMGGGLRH